MYLIANGWHCKVQQLELVEYASGASSLSELSDVSISNPTDGQVLTYNATTQKWENKTPTGGGATNITAEPFGFSASSFDNSIGLEGIIQ